jgi:hypothetical protein
MDLTGDRIAGVVDLFGALDRDDLRRALDELAFKRGADLDDERAAAAIDRAVRDYRLVELDGRLVAGPAAFPELPAGAEDLPHILDVPDRSVDRAALTRAVEERFRSEAARAAAAGDTEAVDRLLDLSYDVEAATDADLARARDRLEAARGGAE